MVFCSFKSDYIQQTFGEVSAYRAESMPEHPVSELHVCPVHIQIVQVSSNCLVNIRKKREKI